MPVARYLDGGGYGEVFVPDREELDAMPEHELEELYDELQRLSDMTHSAMSFSVSILAAMNTVPMPFTHKQPVAEATKEARAIAGEISDAATRTRAALMRKRFGVE